MTLTDFLEENRAYMDEPSLANLEGLSDEDFAALRALCLEAFDGDEPGIDCKVVRVAQGSVESFDDARASWAQRGTREDCAVHGRACAIYRDVQAVKGQERNTLAVMSRGDAAIILQG